jgi:F-type H+-transporting ATPase subunit b
MDLVGELSNGVLWYQLALIGALALVLKFVLFDPFVRVFEARETLLRGGAVSPDEVVKQADAQFAAFEAQLKTARTAALAARDKTRIQWHAERDAIVAQATTDAETYRTHALADLDVSVTTARKGIETHAREAASDITRRVLGRA